MTGRSGAAALASAVLVLSPAAAQVAAPPGATACSGCHGPAAGPSVGPSLHGRPASEIAAAMAGFREGRIPATVMDRIARGFDPAETAAIAEWIARQP